MRDTLTVVELEAVINRLRRDGAADDGALSATLQALVAVYAGMVQRVALEADWTWLAAGRAYCRGWLFTRLGLENFKENLLVEAIAG
ncbi:DUF3717 domain-containing protein [Duganella sp. FT109W]|uniref:DUF3717 domain-containing protein n=1 Tax=Duganella margarita TaxID=2692170 RepID=A0ABW9WNL2_9BURK|nr:DUF3717 domain-containing protein [Duganella margarita]MYN42763.1 DUF3717 domain-containing protein [Duganella margarita]